MQTEGLWLICIELAMGYTMNKRRVDVLIIGDGPAEFSAYQRRLASTMIFLLPHNFMPATCGIPSAGTSAPLERGAIPPQNPDLRGATTKTFAEEIPKDAGLYMAETLRKKQRPRWDGVCRLVQRRSRRRAPHARRG
jgi:hypothetical protein